jgi:predicted O-methyltransferase YrrM
MTVPSFEQVMTITQGVSSHVALEDAEARAYYDLLVSLPQGATVLEIGLQFGRSSSIVAQLQKAKELQYIGIDPFTDPPDAGEAWRNLMEKIDADYTLHTVRTEQVSPSAIPALDLALIDGDHWAAGVKIDCDLVLPKIKSGGYACFHDYGRESLPDVYPTVNSAMVASLMEANWKELPTVGTLGIWQKG